MESKLNFACKEELKKGEEKKMRKIRFHSFFNEEGIIHLNSFTFSIISFGTKIYLFS